MGNRPDDTYHYLVWQFCKLQEEGQSLLWVAMTQLNLWTRTYHRIQQLVCTIADLGGGKFQSPYLAEALQFGSKLRLE